MNAWLKWTADNLIPRRRVLVVPGGEDRWIRWLGRQWHRRQFFGFPEQGYGPRPRTR